MKRNFIDFFRSLLRLHPSGISTADMRISTAAAQYLNTAQAVSEVCFPR